MTFSNWNTCYERSQTVYLARALYTIYYLTDTHGFRLQDNSYVLNVTRLWFLKSNFLGGNSVIGRELRVKYEECITLRHLALHNREEGFNIFLWDAFKLNLSYSLLIKKYLIIKKSKKYQSIMC